MRTHLKKTFSAAMTVGFGCKPLIPSRPPIFSSEKDRRARNSYGHTFVGFRGFRSKPRHFATKVVFEMGPSAARRFNKKIAGILAAGGVGVIATDTIYGIVGSALNYETVKRIYTLRERNPAKPFIVLIPSVADLKKFGVRSGAKIRKTALAFWSEPRPTSIILPIDVSRQARFAYLHRGKGSVAFRLPIEESLKKLLQKTGPLVAPSANLEGKPPAKTLREAKKYFGDLVDFYVDAGKIEGKPSRLIEITKKGMRVLRA